jgi:precorrin-3B C17-methyltransferase
VVGIGPGDAAHLSSRARWVLEHVDTVAGYTTYIDLIKPLIQGKDVIQTGMTREVDRVGAALDVTLSGKSCAIVSSGDPGIYAMAGLVFEMCEQRRIRLRRPSTGGDGRKGGALSTSEDTPLLELEVVPGIPALSAGASLLGAPLTHDFAVISLSDLLTPWEKIEARLEAAAKADFVIVLYNPKSKRRKDHLKKAQEIVLKHRDPETPTGVVVSAMRPEQDISIISLKDLNEASVNMQTIVFIGSSASVRYLDYMVTPRGYAGKYQMADGETTK